MLIERFWIFSEELMVAGTLTPIFGVTVPVNYLQPYSSAQAALLSSYLILLTMFAHAWEKDCPLIYN
jgi:hypothetical protein